MVLLEKILANLQKNRRKSAAAANVNPTTYDHAKIKIIIYISCSNVTLLIVLLLLTHWRA